MAVNMIVKLSISIVSMYHYQAQVKAPPGHFKKHFVSYNLKYMFSETSVTGENSALLRLLVLKT